MRQPDSAWHHGNPAMYIGNQRENVCLCSVMYKYDCGVQWTWWWAEMNVVLRWCSVIYEYASEGMRKWLSQLGLSRALRPKFGFKLKFPRSGQAVRIQLWVEGRRQNSKTSICHGQGISSVITYLVWPRNTLWKERLQHTPAFPLFCLGWKISNFLAWYSKHTSGPLPAYPWSAKSITYAVIWT